jgi:vancomycin resistance protein VanJ
MSAGSKKRSKLILFSLAYLAFLVLLWPVESLWADEHWILLIFAYSPQMLYLIPVVIFLGLALWKRNGRASLLAFASAAVIVFGLMGFRLRSESDEKSELTVMVYNIQHGNQGVPALADFLKRSHADVMLLQEASILDDPSQMHSSLKEAFKGYHLLTGHHVAIASRYPFTSTATHVLEIEQRKYMQEAAIEVNGKEVRLYCLHLEPIQGLSTLTSAPLTLPSHLSTAMAHRRHQVDEARNVIDRLAGPAIIAGDFNGPWRGSVFGRLSQGFTNAFTEVGSGFGLTCPASFPVWRMDYALSRGLQPLRCEVINVQTSDHRPLWVEYRL